ncbi:unnamed protein product [Agarophyton chilense]
MAVLVSEAQMPTIGKRHPCRHGAAPPMAAFLPPLGLPRPRCDRVVPTIASAPSPICLAASPPRSFPPDSHSDLRHAIHECAPSRILPLLTRRLAQSDPPVSPQLWRSALNACLTARNPNAVAAVLFRGLDSPLAVSLHISSFVHPLKFLASISKWNLLFPLLDSMWLVGNAVAPDEKLIVTLANIAVNRDNYRVCLKLFRLMRHHGIEMGPFSYSVLLKSHGRARNVVAVKSALSKICSSKLKVDSVLLNSAVDALVRCNDLSAAMRLIAEDDNKPLLDVSSYNTIIKGFASRGLVSDAFKVVDTMKAAQCTPNQVTTNTLLSACAHAGHFDQAWSLIDNIDFEAPKAKSVTHVPKALSSPQQRRGAKHNSSSSIQLTIAITSLISGLAQAGRVDEALELFSRMKEIKIPPSSITYASLISACFRCNATGRARELFQSFIGDDVISIEVCNAYMSGLCHSRQEENLKQAAAVLDDMLTRKIHIFPDIHSFNCLLDAWVSIRNFEQAELIMELMQANKIRPSITSYTILLRGYSDTGQYGDAKRAFRELSRRRLRPDRIALNAFINVCVRSGDLRAAERVVAQMEQRKGAISPSAKSYSPIIASYFRHGKFDEGWQLYERMRSQKIPLNEYLVQYMTIQLSQNNDIQGNTDQVQYCAQLLKDGLADGVNVKMLRRCRKKMLGELRSKRNREALNQLANEPEFRLVSEQIFDRHGWNQIDSGWRVF